MNVSPRLYSANLNKRYAIHQGGASAGKTWCNMYYCAMYANNHSGTIISIVSESLPHLRRGCIRDFKTIIKNEGWEALFKENKSNNTWTTEKGSVIEFFGADEESKLRGARRDILFINECNNIPYEAFQQLDVRTRKRTILDFNPVSRFWVHDKLIPSLQDYDYNYLISTYKDNVGISEEEVANIERRKGNENWWRVYGLGEIGSVEGLVFNNWSIVEDVLPGKLIGYGIDFGFVHSPCTIVQVNEYEGQLYIRELLYKINVSNEELFDFASKNVDLNEQSIADSAEPKTIDFLYKKGWRGLKPSVKGPDSIVSGINLLLDYKINITRNSVNMIKEFRNYSWDNDKNGNKVNKPIKEFDHSIDALRYLISYPKKKEFIFA